MEARAGKASLSSPGTWNASADRGVRGGLLVAHTLQLRCFSGSGKRPASARPLPGRRLLLGRPRPGPESEEALPVKQHPCENPAASEVALPAPAPGRPGATGAGDHLRAWRGRLGAAGVLAAGWEGLGRGVMTFQTGEQATASPGASTPGNPPVIS